MLSCFIRSWTHTIFNFTHNFFFRRHTSVFDQINYTLRSRNRKCKATKIKMGRLNTEPFNFNVCCSSIKQSGQWSQCRVQMKNWSTPSTHTDTNNILAYPFVRLYELIRMNRRVAYTYYVRKTRYNFTVLYLVTIYNDKVKSTII